MKTSFIFILVSLMFTVGIHSQSNLNEFKYIIVPKKYDFLKESDQYQLNSLTKFLFKKEGFTVYFDDDILPNELAQNRCLSLLTNVRNDSNLFRTKLIVELKDCNNKIVYSSNEGTSKKKEYKVAYHEALREAFQSFKALSYSYKPKQVIEVGDDNINYAIKHSSQKQQIEKQEEFMKPKTIEIPEKKIEIQNPEISEEVQLIQKKFMSQKPLVDIVDKELIAKPFDLGYNVFDSNSNIVMVLLTTGTENVYLVKDKNAIVNKNNNGTWNYSENDGINFLVIGIRIELQ